MPARPRLHGDELNPSGKSLTFAAWMLLGTPTMASAESIGLFADPSGSRCDFEAPLYQPTRAYVLFRNPGWGAIQGFEFGIRGLPQGWLVDADYCGGCSIVLPSIFGDGARYGWAACRMDVPVFIAPAWILATRALRNVELTVGARIPPTNPSFNCPLVALCDAPVYTAVCVAAQATFINSDTRCSVGIERTSWGQVKAIYD